MFRLRGQAGLQILGRSGDWSPVPVVPPGTTHDTNPPILVNIGDLLSYWTNGLFRSTVHRVVFEPPTLTGSSRDHSEPSLAESHNNQESDNEYRYSIAFFCHPAHETPLDAVPCERIASAAQNIEHAHQSSRPYAERRVMTAQEHLASRLADTYGDYFKAKEAEK